jgi:hypothetical protein
MRGGVLWYYGGAAFYANNDAALLKISLKCAKN